MREFLLGFDLGSSSVKASLIDIDTGHLVVSATSPDMEMPIEAPCPGWAEQDPELWWNEMIHGCEKLRSSTGLDILPVKAVGISYQEHGLVAVDREGKPLRPAIIWCDSRAVPIGNRALREIGEELCFSRLLNSPGNFTASKLAWVRENEPGVYKKIDKIMLPGDYIGMKLTGIAATTLPGLSEGMFFDFAEENLATFVLSYYGIDPELIPQLVPTFGDQGKIIPSAANALGITPGARLCFRAGDQHANAFGLKVLDPGDAAANAGTSGVVYAVWDQRVFDARSRVNTFLHVNHRKDQPRYSVVLCVNGAGILYSWLRRVLSMPGGRAVDYDHLNHIAAQCPIGSEGLVILPYGNGSERTLENKNPGASMLGLNFNIHERAHLVRAAQEGIAFALQYGNEILKNLELNVKSLRAGRGNLFLSPLFSTTLATLFKCSIELFNTDGSQAAARGAGLGIGWYNDYKEALFPLKCEGSYEPDMKNFDRYQEAYVRWKDELEKVIPISSLSQ